MIYQSQTVDQKLRTINVLVAYDNQMFFSGIMAMFADHENIRVFATVNNEEQILDHLAEKSIDVLILDINVSITHGLKLIRNIKEHHPGVEILVFTMFVEKELIADLIDVGASGYILNDSGKKGLESAIVSAVNGKKHIENNDNLKIPDANNSINGLDTGKESVNNNFKLTKREIEVLKLIAHEYTTPQIAENLLISTYTVETHRKKLIRKLKVKNIAGLVKYAVQKGLVS
ncbi:MAG: response regulator transcription factor [Bacteroidota bacterium]